jgi:acetolactate synthase-1/3 small subunit
VLARVIGLFSGRGYNIDSLTVSETEHAKHQSRITIVTTGTPMVLSQIRNQLDRMVPVHAVIDLTAVGNPLERELALVKVTGRGNDRVEALRIADAFEAEVVDASTEHFIFQLTGRDGQDRAVHRHHGAARPDRGLPHRQRRPQPGDGWPGRLKPEAAESLL